MRQQSLATTYAGCTRATADNDRDYVQQRSALSYVMFGQLPIGATFFANVVDKEPSDKRRKRITLTRYEKRSHGSQAGFAAQVNAGKSFAQGGRTLQPATSDRRFTHATLVQIDATDLRLIVACLRKGE